jgi:hypothetical protein
VGDHIERGFEQYFARSTKLSCQVKLAPYTAAQLPEFFLGAEPALGARVRTYITRAWISSSVVLLLKEGIFPFPSTIDWASSASVFF